MDDQTRMLTGLTGLGGLQQPDVGDPDSVRKQQSLGQPQQDIGDILQQIMAITDESLDEAQARSWPEESPAHWGGSDGPTEGGRAGGGMAGGGLPLNFQHRSVLDRMHTFFSPLLLIPSMVKTALPHLKLSSDRFCGRS
ncbi:hypothetical protein CHARACLAT_000687 [Characodon lateralis]|uniref:Uncharacterized protein n=1 Tax=Characodon lateralis TaxID=208331 RepID=A0ABU7D694_9TELE|nr:hypothetical protein [Characodon lateralis]